MERIRDEAFSLFVDGLPLEMSWDWLLQVFRGIGEICDVFVSHKIRRNKECRFGFVRFKYLEDARKAIRNLNGTRIRDKMMMISFAKYGRNKKSWSIEGEDKDKIPVRNEENDWKTQNGMRSYKEAVLGVPNQQRREAWVRKRTDAEQDKEPVRVNKEIDNSNLNVVVARVVEEMFRSENLTEMKRIFANVMIETMKNIQGEEVNEVRDLVHSKNDEKTRVNGLIDKQHEFLEDELVRSLGWRFREGDDVLRKSLTVEASGQSAASVGPESKSAKQVCYFGPDVETRPGMGKGRRPSIEGIGSPNSSSPEFPPGFDAPYGLYEKPSEDHDQNSSLGNDGGDFEGEDNDEIEENGGDSSDKVP